jgi:hypothetical protein
VAARGTLLGLVRLCGKKPQPSKTRLRYLLFALEVIRVDLLERVHANGSNSHIMIDHQSGELVTVDEDNLGTNSPCIMLSIVCEA